MSTSLRLARIEVRRSIGLLAFGPMALAAWWAAHGELPSIVWLWPDTSFAIQSSAILLGPLAGGIAAWMAGRDQRRGIAELLTTTPHPPAARSLTTCVGTMAWAALAYLAAAAYLIGMTSWHATWGRPELGPIIVGLLVTVAHTATGFAVGHYLPTRFTAPLVAIALFAAQVMTADAMSSSIQQLSPLRYGARGDVFYDLKPDLAAPFGLWMLGLTGVALVAVVLKSRRNVATWGVLIVATAAAVMGATTLMGSSAEMPIPNRITPIAYDPVCTQGTIEVCVHPAYQVMLDDATDLIGKMTQPLVGLPGVPARAEQRSLMFGSRPIEGLLTFELNNVTEAGYKALAFDIARKLVGTVDRPPEASVQAVVGDWLIQQAGVPLRVPIGTNGYQSWSLGSDWSQEGKDALRRFAALEPETRREWLEEHYADLRAGKLTLEDLP